MDCVVAVGAEVVGGGIAGGVGGGGLAADDAAAGDWKGLLVCVGWNIGKRLGGQRTAALGEVVTCDWRIDTCIAVHQVHGIEAEVAALEGVALVDGAVVKQVLQVGGVVVRNIGDVLEGVGER